MSEESRALTTGQAAGPVALMQQANEMAQAMVEFLPGAKDVPEATRKAMAMLAIRQGLDPFLGEVYAVPQRKKNDRTGAWETVGYSLGVGRGGWLRNAERSGLYRGHGFRELTPTEAKYLRVGDADIGIACWVRKVPNANDGGHRGYDVEGFGVVKADDKSKMEPYKLARKRAFVDALRNAFPMQVPTVGGQQMDVRIIDEDTGEILGNGHEPGVQTLPPEPPSSIEADMAEFSEETPKAPAAKPVDDLPWDDAEVTPVPAPAPKPRSRGELMNQLQALAMEYYPSAPGIALNNHLKKECNGKSIGMLSVDELLAQISVFQARIAEKQEVAE
jgi:hypothetical protein